MAMTVKNIVYISLFAKYFSCSWHSVVNVKIVLNVFVCTQNHLKIHCTLSKVNSSHHIIFWAYWHYEIISKSFVLMTNRHTNILPRSCISCGFFSDPLFPNIHNLCILGLSSHHMTDKISKSFI